MKKQLTERFQQLAGIKSLYEQESDNQELSDGEKDYLHDILNDFIKDKVIGDGMSNEKLEAALKFLILDIQNLEPFLYRDTDGDGTPDAFDDDADKPEPHQFGLTGDQSDFGGSNPNR